MGHYDEYNDPAFKDDERARIREAAEMAEMMDWIWSETVYDEEEGIDQREADVYIGRRWQ